MVKRKTWLYLNKGDSKGRQRFKQSRKQIFFHASGYFKYTVSFWFHLIKYTTPTVLRSLVEYLNIMAVCIFCLHLSKLQSACMYHKMELKISFRSFISHVVQNMQYLSRKKSDLSIINLKEISLYNFSLYDVHKCIKKKKVLI